MTRFNDGIQYELDHNVTNKELGAITPAVIFCWICLEVYGNPDTNLYDNPTQGRSSSIAYEEKDISYYMPNRLMYCNDLATPPVENPIKSILVNYLIKILKNKEL